MLATAAVRTPSWSWLAPLATAAGAAVSLGVLSDDAHAHAGGLTDGAPSNSSHDDDNNKEDDAALHRRLTDAFGDNLYDSLMLTWSMAAGPAAHTLASAEAKTASAAGDDATAAPFATWAAHRALALASDAVTPTAGASATAPADHDVTGLLEGIRVVSMNDVSEWQLATGLDLAYAAAASSPAAEAATTAARGRSGGRTYSQQLCALADAPTPVSPGLLPLDGYGNASPHVANGTPLTFASALPSPPLSSSSSLAAALLSHPLGTAVNAQQHQQQQQEEQRRRRRRRSTDDVAWAGVSPAATAIMAATPTLSQLGTPLLAPVGSGQVPDHPDSPPRQPARASAADHVHAMLMRAAAAETARGGSRAAPSVNTHLPSSMSLPPRIHPAWVTQHGLKLQKLLALRALYVDEAKALRRQYATDAAMRLHLLALPAAPAAAQAQWQQQTTADADRQYQLRSGILHDALLETLGLLLRPARAADADHSAQRPGRRAHHPTGDDDDDDGASTASSSSSLSSLSSSWARSGAGARPAGRRYDPATVQALERYYQMDPYPDEAARRYISATLSLSPRQVINWFTNKRMRTQPRS
jgi:hypothetical protein